MGQGAIRPAYGAPWRLHACFQPIVKSQNRNLVEIQFVVSAQDAFDIHKHDESFRKRHSPDPA